MQESVAARRAGVYAWVQEIGFRTAFVGVSSLPPIREGKMVLSMRRSLLSMKVDVGYFVEQAILLKPH